MKINLSSKSRFKNFNFDNAKAGDYVIEEFPEPYVFKVQEINGYKIKLKIIALINMDGEICFKNVFEDFTYHKDSDYVHALKVLPKKYIHQINKLIIFSNE